MESEIERISFVLIMDGTGDRCNGVHTAAATRTAPWLSHSAEHEALERSDARLSFTTLTVASSFAPATTTTVTARRV